MTIRELIILTLSLFFLYYIITKGRETLDAVIVTNAFSDLRCVSDKENNNAEQQKKLNKNFDEIKKDFEELRKENQNLAQPMDFPDTRFDEDVTKELMEQATEKRV